MPDTNQQQLAKLFEELKTLFGPPCIPTEAQVGKAKEIHTALDGLFGRAQLTPEEYEQAARLFALLDGITEPRKLLSKDEQQRADELSDEIDAILRRHELLADAKP